MKLFTPAPRGLSAVALAVRHALEHASAQGDEQTAAELAAILRAMTVRSAAMADGAWDTVPASGWAH